MRSSSPAGNAALTPSAAASYDLADMAAATVEQRLRALELEVSRLRVQVQRAKADKPWWDRLGGMFKDDTLFDEMVKAGQKYRRSLRPPSKSG